MKQIALAAATLILLTYPAGADELLARAQALINEGRPAEALDVLAGFEGQRAGEVQFDYLLGLATLDSGDPGKAVLVFERLLAVESDFHGARLEYARALYEIGNLTEAEAQFQRVAASGPPPAAQRAVDDYLAQIRRRQQRLKFSRWLDVRTRGGFDSNVNSATELQEFLGFSLSDTSREQDSDFFEAGIGGGAAWQPRSGLTLDGRLSYTTRRNGQASFADTDVILGQLRLASETATQCRTLAVQGFALDIDGEDNNSALALSGAWSWALPRQWWLGSALRYGTIRYSDELEVKDVDQIILSAIASRPVGALERGLLRLRLSYGEDDPVNAGSRYARDFLRADASLAWRFTATVSASLSASVEDSSYDAIFFEQLYDSPRSDTIWRGRGAVNWRFAQNWRFFHTLSYSLNDTDVEIFEYERFEFGVGLAWVWR